MPPDSDSLLKPQTLLYGLLLVLLSLATALPSAAAEEASAVRGLEILLPLGKLRGLEAEETEARLKLAGELETLEPGNLLSAHIFASHDHSANYDPSAWEGRKQRIEASGDGSEDRPFLVENPADAYGLLAWQEKQVLGAIYALEDSRLPRLDLTTKSAKAPRHHLVSFYIDPWFARVLRQNPPVSNLPPATHLITTLAQHSDDAAQAAIGLNLFLASPKASRKAGLQWLKHASQTGNLRATLILANAYQTLAQEELEWRRDFWISKAEKAFMSAVVRDSDRAMHSLAMLKLSFGPASAGDFLWRLVPSLLERARFLGNVEATSVLASLYANGHVVEKKPPLADAILRKAAATGNREARLEYARLHLNHDLLAAGVKSDRQAYKWMRELVSQGDIRAMVELGRMRARGYQVRRNFRKAKRWWQAAGEGAEEAALINWIAYILVAAEEPELRDSEFALRIMDALMESSEAARKNYAYLDTWATAYAATGDWDRALELQRQALHQVRQTPDTESLKILGEHMDAFQRREIIYDVTTY